MPNRKIILGLVGEIASGKGTVAKYLEKKYKASFYRFSTILRDILNRLYLEMTRENIQKTSTMIRKYYNEDILAKVMAEDVKNENNNIIIVDGVRRLADIKFLKKLPGFKLVKVVSKPEIRFKRLIKRKENKDDKNKTYKQFLADHKKEADREVPKVMERAKLEINNDGSLKELYKQIDRIIKKSK